MQSKKQKRKNEQTNIKTNLHCRMGSFPDPADQWYVQNQSLGPPQRGLMDFYLPLLQKGNIELSQICLYQSVSEIKEGEHLL